MLWQTWFLWKQAPSLSNKTQSISEKDSRLPSFRIFLLKIDLSKVYCAFSYRNVSSFIAKHSDYEIQAKFPWKQEPFQINFPTSRRQPQLIREKWFLLRRSSYKATLDDENADCPARRSLYAEKRETPSFALRIPVGCTRRAWLVSELCLSRTWRTGRTGGARATRGKPVKIVLRSPEGDPSPWPMRETTTTETTEGHDKRHVARLVVDFASRARTTRTTEVATIVVVVVENFPGRETACARYFKGSGTNRILARRDGVLTGGFLTCRRRFPTCRRSLI